MNIPLGQWSGSDATKELHRTVLEIDKSTTSKTNYIIVLTIVTIIIGLFSATVQVFTVKSEQVEAVSHVEVVENFENSTAWKTTLAQISGSFIGAVIILGLERLINYSEKLKKQKHANKALMVEIGTNIVVCEHIIEILKDAHHAIYVFSKFSTYWMDLFLNEYIDYAEKDSLRLYSFLVGAKKLITQIDSLEKNQYSLNGSARALGSFEQLAFNGNQAILIRVRELKNILEIIEKIKKENKIFKEDIDRYKDKITEETINLSQGVQDI